MSAFKCKMCGGALEIQPGDTVAVCEYCGAKQTLPKLNDEKRVNLYDRANHFRRNNEFDKASEIYDQILNEDGADAEAYWSLVLCRFGIEYVEDPATHRRVPTVHRAQYTSIFDDDNYKLALENADSYQKIIYEEEAKAINEIQKGILAISEKEEPFDVFICYKETDNSGKRTHDSVLAQDLYYQLTQEGFKVFFARITLEDKLGSAYEPYIFAALNSAKVMVVLGTKSEFFNAVWVKNEWSRYLSLIKNGAKKTLIPAYRDMDPYDLPQEFSHLQAQDMSKLGFMQDLIRGINKIVNADKHKSGSSKATVSSQNAAANPLLERAFIFIEDGDFQSGDAYCEKVLDFDPRCAEAYLGKLMIDMKVTKRRQLAYVNRSFADNSNYKRIVRFGSQELVEEINEYLDEVNSAKLSTGYVPNQSSKNSSQTDEKARNTISEREKNEKRFAEISEQYKRIPSDNAIRDIVKRSQPVKRLETIGIILLILYWPASIVLFIIRANKIKQDTAIESSKYDAIRKEYARLKALLSTPKESSKEEINRLFNLTVTREKQLFAWNPDITMKVGNATYCIKKESTLSLALKPGRYELNFSAAFQKRCIYVNLTQDTTVSLRWNRTTGQLVTEIVNK